MDHDFDKQREETLWVWRDLSAKKSLPKTATLDLQFVSAPAGADRERFEALLTAAGYIAKRYDDDRTLEASIGPIVLSADEIWKHEFATSKIALQCGFRPDGWGFFSN